jgi:spoIIIJ-associated protein
MVGSRKVGFWVTLPGTRVVDHKEGVVESLEVCAKTVDEAIERALAKLGKTRDQVQISVLSEGSRGILGIGGEEARILVSPMPTSESPAVETPAEFVESEEEVPQEDIEDVAREVLEDLLAAMHMEAAVTVHEPDEDEKSEGSIVSLDISGADLGILIGRRGETLSSLQFITNLIVSRRLKKWVKVIVDVEGYRVRRQETLRGLALRMAERAKMTRQPVTLEAMPAQERRIVHIALQNHPHVTTESTGEGEDRKVVIIPKRFY